MGDNTELGRRAGPAHLKLWGWAEGTKGSVLGRGKLGNDRGPPKAADLKMTTHRELKTDWKIKGLLLRVARRTPGVWKNGEGGAFFGQSLMPPA